MPTPRRELVRTGEIGVLRAGASNSDVIVGVDKAANEELTKMAVSKDTEGFAGMMLSGRAFVVPAGTRARLLDTNFTLGFLPTSVRVRILEGQFHGRDGVVPHEWLVPAPAGTSDSPTPEARRAQPAQSAPPSKKSTPRRKP